MKNILATLLCVFYLLSSLNIVTLLRKLKGGGTRQALKLVKFLSLFWRQLDVTLCILVCPVFRGGCS
jgi:hypothetical protein